MVAACFEKCMDKRWLLAPCCWALACRFVLSKHCKLCVSVYQAAAALLERVKDNQPAEVLVPAGIRRET